jgi:hypothetical protein
MIVQDLEQAVDRWSKLLGVLDAGSLVEPPVYLHGDPGGVVSDTATFVNPDGCEIQLICPRNDPAREAFGCDRRGPEFVHHIAFVTDDVPEAGRKLRAEGFKTTAFWFDDEIEEPVSAAGLEGAEWNEWYMVPMEDGNVLTEIILPYTTKDSEWAPAEDWTVDKRLPDIGGKQGS